MAIDLLPDITTGLTSVSHWADTLHTWHWHLPFDLAQGATKITEADPFGDVQRAFNNFVKTGQVWAFLIGLIIGYVVRSFTSYG